MEPPPDPAPGVLEVLAAGIAHEVRNPLNAMQLHLEILGQELAGALPDRQAPAFAVLARLASELRQLDHFVADFLRYARPPALRIEPVNVRSLVTDLATFFSPECARKEVELALELDDGPSAALLDGFQFKHALLNLLLNALQASPAGGRILVTLTATAEEMLFRVQDDGEGIPAGMEERVFDVFFTMRAGGTGLGLPIARRIVEQHGGSLALERAPGGGARATLRLPRRGRP